MNDVMDKVIVIVGPTGIGKTEISLKMCEKYNGEIINCDASQMKKKLNIGTAKIDLTKTKVKHHLIDIIEPNETFSCADFQRTARDLVTKINSEGKIPFIVGGTGLYASCAIYNYKLSDRSRNAKFDRQYANYTNQELHEILKSLDPISAGKIHFNNRIRVLRAIECAQNGNKLSDKDGKQTPYYLKPLVICLASSRDYLYERINKRVYKMIEEGFVEEVKELKKEGYDPFLFPDLGYRRIDEYLDGLLSLETTIEEIQKETRHYAKRQISWFNNQMKCIHIDVDTKQIPFEEVIDELIKEYVNS